MANGSKPHGPYRGAGEHGKSAASRKEPEDDFGAHHDDLAFAVTPFGDNAGGKHSGGLIEDAGKTFHSNGTVEARCFSAKLSTSKVQTLGAPAANRSASSAACEGEERSKTLRRLCIRRSLPAFIVACDA